MTDAERAAAVASSKSVAENRECMLGRGRGSEGLLLSGFSSLSLEIIATLLASGPATATVIDC